MRTFFFILLFSLTITFSKAQSDYSAGTIHMGVVVEDLQESLDFYKSVMGMLETGTIEIDEDFGKRSGLNTGEAFTVRILKVIDSPEATQFKVMSFNNESNHPRQSYVRDDHGIQYITVYVNSLAPFLERIKKHNVKLLGSTPTHINDELSFILIQDPDGNFVEIIGPPA